MPLDQTNMFQTSEPVMYKELKKIQVVNLVKALMEKGREIAPPKSHSHGWSMCQIVDEVCSIYGNDMRDFTRAYIIEDVCGMRSEGAKSARQNCFSTGGNNSVERTVLTGRRQPISFWSQQNVKGDYHAI